MSLKGHNQESDPAACQPGFPPVCSAADGASACFLLLPMNTVFVCSFVVILRQDFSVAALAVLGCP